MTKQKLTTKKIRSLSDTKFWDHYEMVAESATQDPQSFDVTELRRFQNEAHRRFEEVIASPPKSIDPDAPNF